MSKKPKGASAPGRVAPPVDTHFAKGTCGNPAGRPTGAISLKRLTRKFALKKQKVTISGKAQRYSRLEIAILKLQSLASTGKPSAVSLLARLRTDLSPIAPDLELGCLLVPATPLSTEEFLAEIYAAEKDKVEPKADETNVEAEEYLKALRGEPSPLGEAIIAFRRKYRAREN